MPGPHASVLPPDPREPSAEPLSALPGSGGSAPPSARPAPADAATVHAVPVLSPAPRSAIERWVVPAAIGAGAPLASAVAIAMASDEPPSSLGALARSVLPTAHGLAVVSGWLAAQAALVAAFPGTETPERGRRARRPTDGLAAWALTHGLLLGAWAIGRFGALQLRAELGSIASSAALVAFGISIALAIRGRARGGPDAELSRSPLWDLFRGIERSPSVLGIDLERWLVRGSAQGASVLSLVIVASLLEESGSVSPGVLVVALLSWLRGLLAAADEDAPLARLERSDARLGHHALVLGLVTGPFLAAVPLAWLATHRSPLGATACVVVLTIGIAALAAGFAEGIQRRALEHGGGRLPLWGSMPRLVRARYLGADGAYRGTHLCASGVAGLARHFHHLPELALALLSALAAGPSLAVAVATALVVATALDQARREDARCLAKYGGAWAYYAHLVPARVVPGLF